MRFIRKTQGAVSIFLVIILLPMLTLSSVIIDSSRIKLGKSMAATAGDLTLNTALTNYDTVLKDVYGLFAISQNDDELMNNLEDYFTKTIKSNGTSNEMAEDYASKLVASLKTNFLGNSKPTTVNDLMQTKVLDFTAEGVSNSSLANPGVLKKQIVEFMKYRGPVSMGMGFFDSLSAFKGMAEKKEVVDKKVEYYKKQSDVTAVCQLLYQSIDKFNRLDLKFSVVKTKVSEADDIYKNTINNYLISDLYLNSSQLSSPKYTFGGSETSGFTCVKSSGTVDIPTQSLSAAYNNFKNRVKEYNSNQIVRDMNSSPNSADFYAPQFLGQYNAMYSSEGYYGYGELVKEIYSSFMNYKLECEKPAPPPPVPDPGAPTVILTPAPPEKANYADALSEYNSIMSKAVQVSGIAIQKFNSGSWSSYIGNRTAEFNTKIEGIYKVLNPVYKVLPEAIENLEAASENLVKVRKAVEELQTAQKNFKSALDNPALPNDSFAQTTNAEYKEISEIFKLSDIDSLIEKVSAALTQVKAMKVALDSYKYSNALVCDLGNLNTVKKAASSVKMPSAYSAYKISLPPVKQATIEELKNQFFTENYKKTDVSKITEPTLVNSPKLPFYTYLMSNFKGTPNSETNQEFKVARDNLSSSSENNLKDLPSDAGNGGSTSAFGYVPRDLTKAPDGASDSWTNPSKGSVGGLSSGSSKISGGNNKDNLKDDKAEQTLSGNSAFISGLFKGFEEYLKDARDNLYTTEYAMKMFSYNTMYNEIRYDQEKKSGSPNFTEIIGKSNKTSEILKEAATMTGVPIDDKNNYAFGAEVEYLVFGNKTTGGNVVATYGSIFGIRMMLNTIYAFTSPDIRLDAFNVAVPISAASLGLFPVPLVQAVIQIGMALAETSLDLVYLKEGMPIPIYKNKDTWKIGSVGALNAMKDVAKTVGEKAVVYIVDKTATTLQEYLDMADEELTTLTKEQLDQFKVNIDTAVNGVFEEAGGAVVTKLTEICSAAVQDRQADITAKIDVPALEKELRDYVNSPGDNEFIREAKTLALDIILDSQYQYVKQLTDILQNTDSISTDAGAKELTKIVNEIKNKAIGKIDAVLSNAGNKLFDYKDNAKNYISEGINKGKEQLKKRIDEQFGKLGNAGKFNAGSTTSSLFSFQYSDYLRLFLFISVSSGEGALKRIGDLIQYNVATSSTFNHGKKLDFRMGNAYTYVNINADIEVKPLLTALPFVANSIKDPQSNTNWYKFKYSGLAGY